MKLQHLCGPLIAIFLFGCTSAPEKPGANAILPPCGALPNCVNSQSGKGGVAYVMKSEHGFDLPRRLQIEFSKNIQHITEDLGTEISPLTMWTAFQAEYLPDVPHFVLESHEMRSVSSGGGRTTITAQLVIDGAHTTITGDGNGPIDAFVNAMRSGLGASVDVVDYSEHAIGKGSEARAVAYVETINEVGDVLWGVGTDENTVTASLRAVLSAYERHTHATRH